ncbi:MAG: SAM-dependent methyltransferase [Ruminococcaceae bacterium]|nr:SAM-dependent methyltransferase [Oscillospiraceae bacterium]
MELTGRLNQIACCIPPCDTLADIGTDHAYIPIYCVQKGIATRALACDVNRGPLDIARENIAGVSLSDCIETRLSDGLEGLAPDEADVIVIAGMGGQLISEILARGADRISPQTTLVLQPMIAVEELRRYLYENSYCIAREILAAEGRKLYHIMTVRQGKTAYTEEDVFVGRLSEDPLYERYLEYKINVNEKIIAGLERSRDGGNVEFYRNLRQMYRQAKDPNRKDGE